MPREPAVSRHGWDELREGERWIYEGKRSPRKRSVAAGGAKASAEAVAVTVPAEVATEKVVPRNRPFPFPGHTENRGRPTAPCLSPSAKWHYLAGEITKRDD